MIIFLTIVLTVYSLANYYIFRRGFQALPDDKWFRIGFVVIFFIFVLSYVIGRILERYDTAGIAEFFTCLGSFWLGAMLYFILSLLLIDILRAVNHFIPFFPEFITSNWPKTKFIALISVVSITFILIVSGYINASNPVVKELNIKINKKVDNLKTLRIAVASDIHIGNIINRKRVEKLVGSFKELRPDIILLPGDILDEDVAPVIREGMGEPLKSLNPRFGVWAITGNHEYIGGVNPAVKYLNSMGIKVIRDEYIEVDNKFILVGREDRDMLRFTGKNRKGISEIMKGIDESKPIILMDHQPFKLEEAVAHGVDLQLSGHTHHGQLWPLNFITNLVYEVSWGYKQKENTHFYISSGYGSWGPPLRTGNTPEIVLITITFD